MNKKKLKILSQKFKLKDVKLLYLALRDQSKNTQWNDKQKNKINYFKKNKNLTK